MIAGTIQARQRERVGDRMPTYQRKQCGERGEILGRRDERGEKAVCPHCGGKDVATMLTTGFTAPPIHPKPF